MDTNGVMKTYKIKIKNPIMGVPITFLDKYCPTQFEIIGIAKDGSGHKWDLFKPFIEGKQKYARILIKKRDNQ